MTTHQFLPGGEAPSTIDIPKVKLFGAVNLSEVLIYGFIVVGILLILAGVFVAIKGVKKS